MIFILTKKCLTQTNLIKILRNDPKYLIPILAKCELLFSKAIILCDSKQEYPQAYQQAHYIITFFLGKK